MTMHTVRGSLDEVLNVDVQRLVDDYIEQWWHLVEDALTADELATAEDAVFFFPAGILDQATAHSFDVLRDVASHVFGPVISDVHVEVLAGAEGVLDEDTVRVTLDGDRFVDLARSVGVEVPDPANIQPGAIGEVLALCDIHPQRLFAGGPVASTVGEYMFDGPDEIGEKIARAVGA